MKEVRSCPYGSLGEPWSRQKEVPLQCPRGAKASRLRYARNLTQLQPRDRRREQLEDELREALKL